MPYAILCEIKEGATYSLKRLRLDHLRYIREHQNEILFGGPARAGDGTPQTMLIIVKTDDEHAANRFIVDEPYNHSGEVFAAVKVRAWSQVMPEVAAGALDDAIEAEVPTQL